MSQYQPPPIRPPNFPVSRETSPQPEETAKEDLTERLKTFEQPLPPLIIRPADNRTALDYIYVSLPDLVDPPRPDILDELRQAIGAKYPDLRIIWRCSGGFDRFRQVWFYVDPALSLAPEEAKDGLEAIFSSPKTHRITFTFTNSHIIDALLGDHPVVKHHTLLPHRPRFIQPYYGLEIAVPGCSVYQTAKSVLDQYIIHKYGPHAIYHIRTELDGDVYCVVLHSWDITASLLRDDSTAFNQSRAFAHFLSSACPILLFVLNTYGVPSNFASIIGNVGPNANEVSLLKSELDELRRQIARAAELYARMLERQEEINHHVNAQTSKVMGAMAAVVLYSSAQITLAQAQNPSAGHRLMLQGQVTLLQPRIGSALHDIDRYTSELALAHQQLLPEGTSSKPPSLPPNSSRPRTPLSPAPRYPPGMGPPSSRATSLGPSSSSYARARHPDDDMDLDGSSAADKSTAPRKKRRKTRGFPSPSLNPQPSRPRPLQDQPSDNADL
ncbi:hypothetical protein DFS33DRAFT_1484844 [Desarmillaria ectypa]|nr:hypothetical protein DFS33DRAFT_1484844 [Desarmillaria ectypa]